MEYAYLSGQNKIIKQMRSLLKRNGRHKAGRFLAEGLRTVTDILERSDKNNELCGIVEHIVIKRSFAESGGLDDFAKLVHCKCFCVDDTVFDKMCDTRTPQGVMAEVRFKDIPGEQGRFGDWHRPEDKAVLILDGISDPGNMGTILRTAEAAGVSDVVILDGCVDVYNPKVVRATMGSILGVRMYFAENEESALSNIKEGGYKIMVADLDGAEDLYGSCAAEAMKGRIACVIGSEAAGVRKKVLQISDIKVKIPMSGAAESLNAAVAAAIILYEIRRVKGSKG